MDQMLRTNVNAEADAKASPKKKATIGSSGKRVTKTCYNLPPNAPYRKYGGKIQQLLWLLP